MNLPITVAVPLFLRRVDINKWLNSLGKTDYVFLWPRYTIVFAHESDAIAFMLVFGGKKITTKIVQLLENERS